MQAIATRSPSNDTSTKSAGVKHRHTPGPKSVPFFTGTNTFIQTKSICPCDGGCPRCTGVIQPKLTIGQPNDKYEQEADRVADQVMRMPEPKGSLVNGHSSFERGGSAIVQTKPIAEQISPLVQRKCSSCGDLDEEEPVQAKSLTGKAPPVTAGLQNQIQSLRGGGQPLSKSVRNYFEPRFGRDLSNVRVHDHTGASESARLLNARAYTIGNDIMFGDGEFQPETRKGIQLLAHELVHSLQQLKDHSSTIRRQPRPSSWEFNPCIVISGKEVCGLDAKKVCEENRSLPGCNLICELYKCKSPDKPEKCPLGFRTATSSDYLGLCCLKNSIPSEKSCCPPYRAAFKEFRCCPPNQYSEDGYCKEHEFDPTLLCPPDRMSPRGTCCPIGQTWEKGEKKCTPRNVPLPQPPPPITPPPKKKKTPIPPRTILFHIDKPQAWSSFTDSVINHNEFDNLVKEMETDPKKLVQLVGHASSDGKKEYNLILSKRRVKLIASELKKELKKKGINIDARIKKSPDPASSAGCESYKEGHVYCGERKVTGPGNPNDRNVVAELFSTQTPSTSIKISGPNTVDHYCKKYKLPNDSPSCGIFPALNITLRAQGVKKGQPVIWNVAKGKKKVEIVGPSNQDKVTIKGKKESKNKNDVIIKVQSGSNVATHLISVLEPRYMTTVLISENYTKYEVSAGLLYTVKDQFQQPMGKGICIDETITVCDSPFKDEYTKKMLKGAFKDDDTDKNGQAVDYIFVKNSSGIPKGFCIKLDQDLTAGGCGPLKYNIIVITSQKIDVIDGDCTANSNTCP